MLQFQDDDIALYR